MDFLLYALFTAALYLGPSALSLLYSIYRARDLEETNQKQNKELHQVNNELSAAIRNVESSFERVITDLTILKGGMIENDELINTLYEREKLLVQELEILRAHIVTKPKPSPRHASLVKRAETKNAKLASKVKSPKDMVFNMTNTKKKTRRTKQ